MKCKFLLFSSALLFFALLNGCSNSKEIATATESLDIDKKIISLDRKESYGLLGIKSNTAWSVSSSEAWLTCSSASGEGNEVIRISATTANESMDKRNATILVTSKGGITKRVTVTQGTPPELLGFDKESISLDHEESSDLLNILSNTTWSVSSSETWLSYSPASGEGDEVVLISATANESANNRSAYILVTSKEGMTRSVVVTQIGKLLGIDKTSLNFGHEASSDVLTIQSNTTWSVSSSETWLSCSPASGEGNGVVNISATASPIPSNRSATILVTSKGGIIIRSMTVTQAGRPYIVVDITDEVLPTDTRLPFATTGSAVIGSAYHSAIWTVNDPIRSNGAVSVGAREGALGTMVATVMPLEEIVSGKIYRTVNLEAGVYRFSATVYSSQNLTAPSKAYVVAALGNEPPDTDDVELMALGYAALPATNIAVGANPVFSTDFTLSDDSSVSLGFVATLLSGANRQMFFREVKLYSLQ